MEKKDYYDTIYEAVMNIELAMANLSCVRIAMKGNEGCRYRRPFLCT